MIVYKNKNTQKEIVCKYISRITAVFVIFEISLCLLSVFIFFSLVLSFFPSRCFLLFSSPHFPSSLSLFSISLFSHLVFLSLYHIRRSFISNFNCWHLVKHFDVSKSQIYSTSLNIVPLSFSFISIFKQVVEEICKEFWKNYLFE